MRALPGVRLAEYPEYAPVVSSESLILIKGHAYSVPSRLMGHTLRVERNGAALKVYLGREFLLELPCLRGRAASGWTSGKTSRRCCASPAPLPTTGTGTRGFFNAMSARQCRKISSLTTARHSSALAFSWISRTRPHDPEH
jgi:hypothetical protein